MGRDQDYDDNRPDDRFSNQQRHRAEMTGVLETMQVVNAPLGKHVLQSATQHINMAGEITSDRINMLVPTVTPGDRNNMLGVTKIVTVTLCDAYIVVCVSLQQAVGKLRVGIPITYVTILFLDHHAFHF